MRVDMGERVREPKLRGTPRTLAPSLPAPRPRRAYYLFGCLFLPRSLSSTQHFVCAMPTSALLCFGIGETPLRSGNVAAVALMG